MQVPAYDMVRANQPYRAGFDDATKAVLNAGHLIMGPRLVAFEEEFARYCQSTYCIGTGNGLDAMTLALLALGIGPGDEVIVPAFTFIATWFSVVHTGARPMPVDVTPDGLIDPTLLASAITPRTRAILPVHLFGVLATMDPILEIAATSGIAVVEDAAQAHGAERNGRRAGSFGIAAAFSFYPTKNLGALGDGGAVCTSDAALAAAIRRLRNYGSDQKYHHAITGHNTRLDELQAAYLAVKLPNLDEVNARRRRIAKQYQQAFSEARPADVELPHPCSSSVWHQYVVRTSNRPQLQQALTERGVGTMIHYPVAPFDQPCFAGQYDRTQYPVAARLADTVLSLPMGDYLADDEVSHVIQAVVSARGSLVSA